MDMSSARMQMLIMFSGLETELVVPEDRDMHAEDVEIFLEVAFDESSVAGRRAYARKMEGLPEEDYPWSAVRARHYFERDDTFGPLEKMILNGPPALSLILARRTDLDPDLRGDLIPSYGTSGWNVFWERIFQWKADELRAQIGPVGWIPPEEMEPVVEELPPEEPGPLDEPEPGPDEPEPTSGDSPEPTSDTPPALPPASDSIPTTTTTKAPERPNRAPAKRSMTPVIVGAGAVAAVGGAGALTYFLTRNPEPAIAGGQGGTP